MTGKDVVLDSNFTGGVEEQCIPGNSEDTYVPPSQRVCWRSPTYSAYIKGNTRRAPLLREI